MSKDGELRECRPIRSSPIVYAPTTLPNTAPQLTYHLQRRPRQTLRATRALFSSYLRIRTLATSVTSPELQQSRSELLATLQTLSNDLADLVDSVQAVEHDPYRFGLDVDESSTPAALCTRCWGRGGKHAERTGGDG